MNQPAAAPEAITAISGKALDQANLAIDNVFNKDAVISRFTNQFGGVTTQSYAPPRRVTVRMGYKF